jgi:hypothetical protein
VGTQADLSDFFKTAWTDEIKHMISCKDAQTKDNDVAAKSSFARAFASVIQSWLFFGLASKALG